MEKLSPGCLDNEGKPTKCMRIDIIYPFTESTEHAIADAKQFVGSRIPADHWFSRFSSSLLDSVGRNAQHIPDKMLSKMCPDCPNKTSIS